MLNILIVGAGAIGCFVGGRLAANGHQVTLLGRPALMEKIAADGLSLRHPALPAQTVFPQTVTALDNLPTKMKTSEVMKTAGVLKTPAVWDMAYDFILITVKSPDTPQIIKTLTAAALPLTNTHIVSLQNGVGNEEKLAAAFGPEKVIAGTITIPINVPERGVIEVSKDKGGLGLAPLHPGQPVQHLADALNQAGLTAPTYANYRAMKWSKLLLNIVNNASSAILNLPPAQIIAHSNLFDLEIEALQEGAAVMKAQGLSAVKLPGYPANWLARLVSVRRLPLVAKRAVLRPFMLSGRGTKMPSLHIDLAAGRSTLEVGVLNGAIEEAGQKLGIATPVNKTLTGILTRLACGELAWADYQNQPEKLLQAAAAEKKQG